MKRCKWVNSTNTAYVLYHDTEWGVPVHDDRILFEFLVLESAQAGLSWETILNKREGYRKAFKNFDPHKVARMTEKDVSTLLLNPHIVRNKLKIRATITNAQVFNRIQKEFGSFSLYLWGNAPNTLKTQRHSSVHRALAPLELAILLSADLKKRGLKFFGPTICYAYMQAIGMVNDHAKNCFKYTAIQ